MQRLQRRATRLHDLEAYIPGDRRRALAAGIAMPDRVRGAALFADISGFTPLTEALAQGARTAARRGGADRPAEPRLPRAHRGARPLRRPRHLLQRRRDHLLVRRRRRRARHGLRPGDAGDDGAGRRSWSPRPARRVTLAVKVAVTVGAARRFLVGDPGRPADRRPRRAHSSTSWRRPSTRREKGEVVLRSVGAGVAGRSRRDPRAAGRAKTTGAEFGVAGSLAVPVEDAAGDERRGRRCRKTSSGSGCCRPSIERLRSGHGEFLAELRPAYPVFLRFGGIDYDTDDDAIGEARRLRPRRRSGFSRRTAATCST